MADAMSAAFSSANAAPSILLGTMGTAMVEILFMAQLVRHPVQALARRWWCKSLFRAASAAARNAPNRDIRLLRSGVTDP
jgi:hypothetical protein